MKQQTSKPDVLVAQLHYSIGIVAVRERKVGSFYHGTALAPFHIFLGFVIFIRSAVRRSND